MQEERAPLAPEEVFAAIQGATVVDAERRRRSEAALRRWETDSAPGYIDSLLQVAGQPGAVDEASRVLAAVLAKNAVGSSWRKTLGSREWSRVPEGEKAGVRARALACLWADPSDRVAIQVTLLIANIARFDFPLRWPELLRELLAAADPAAPTPPPAKLRALRALKHAAHALRTKRIVAEAPSPGAAGARKHELGPLVERITREREQLHAGAGEALRALAELWRGDFAAVLREAPGWQEAGARSVKALLVLREALLLLPSWDGLEAELRTFLESLHHAVTATAAMVTPEGGGGDARAIVGSKTFERATQCVLAAMDRNPVDFAPYVPHFLPLYSDNALLAMDAATLHAARAKRRVLVMRFLARALLCPVYQLSWLNKQLEGARDEAQQAEVRSVWSRIAAADGALTELLAEPQCSRLVEAIVAKYLALTPAELEEWETDPEQFARAADVEATPDADSPRPCGVALLLCMLVRGEGTVSVALVRLASSLQAQPRRPEVVLLQEAAYRALGEALSQSRRLPGVAFPDWFAAELRGLLAPAAQEEPVALRTLRARALWLLGIGAGELPAPLWCEAAGAAVANLSHADLVVSLAAFSSLVAMQVALLEETDALAEEEALLQRESAPGDLPPAQLGLLLQGKQALGEGLAERQGVLRAKVGCIERRAGGLLELALALEARLEEVESRVRALQLVSVTVELLRQRAQPFLGTIAAALPQVWTAARAAGSGGRETGAVARLHGALMGLLTHLVDRLGPLASQHPGVAQVLLPLLAHGLDPANPEADTLAEEALKLLLVSLASGGGLTPGLEGLLPLVMRVAERGRESGAALPVLEAFLLLGSDRPQLLQPHLPGIAAALQRVVSSTAAALMPGQQPPAAAAGGGDAQQQQQQQQRAPISKETVAEANAAASMATLLLQLRVDAGMLAPALRGMALVVARPRDSGAAPSAPPGLAEGFSEVLARLLFMQPGVLPGLLGGDAAAERRLLDAWLLMASRRSLADLLGEPRAAGLGRLRRHLLAAMLCQLLAADASAALREPPRCARALALCLRVLEERAAFEADQADVAEVLRAHASGAEAIEDVVLARRLELTAVDAMRACDMRAAVAAAASAAAARVPRAELDDALAMVHRTLPSELAQLIGPAGGGGGPPAALPASQAMT